MSINKNKRSLRPLGNLRQFTQDQYINISGNAMSTSTLIKLPNPKPKLNEKVRKNRVIKSKSIDIPSINSNNASQHSNIIALSEVIHSDNTQTKNLPMLDRNINNKSSLNSNKDTTLSPKTENVSVQSVHKHVPTDLTQTAEIAEKIQNEYCDGAVDQLKAHIAENEITIRSKETEITLLETSLATLEAYYKDLYAKECAVHSSTKELLSDTEDRLNHLECQITLQKTQYEDKLQSQHEQFTKEAVEIKKLMTDEIQRIETLKASELHERDARIQKLKNRMSDLLKDNSWERQHQLEDLSKELSRLQEEADDLRIQLKQKHTSNSACPSCQTLKVLLQKTNDAMSHKEQAIHQLNETCHKFSTRLKQLEQQQKYVNKNLPKINH